MHSYFDELTKAVAQCTTRREALKVLGGGVAALFLASVGIAKARAADIDQLGCVDECRRSCTTVTGSRVTTNLACLRRCSARCVPASCLPGNPTPCESDPVTIDSLQAARLALQSGINEGPLSPGGCARYRREVNASGRTTSETILLEGKPALVWHYGQTQATAARDTNVNGCPEWRARVGYDATGKNNLTVIEHLSDPGGKVQRRETYIPAGDVVHVTWEQVDTNGTLQTVARFDADRFQDAAVSKQRSTKAVRATNGSTGCVGENVATVGCNEREVAKLRDRLCDGVAKGLECLQRFKAGDIALTVEWAYTFRNITITCDDFRFRFPGNPSHGNAFSAIDDNGYLDGRAGVEMFVNTFRNKSFFSEMDPQQSQALFHELLHLHFGPHNEQAQAELSRFDEYDRVRACTDLCFNPGNVTRCKCARCLTTDKCDERCRTFTDCDSKLAYICPCKKGKNAFRHFNKCSDCLAECPSGPLCFGVSFCLVESVACPDELQAVHCP